MVKSTSIRLLPLLSACTYVTHEFLMEQYSTSPYQSMGKSVCLQKCLTPDVAIFLGFHDDVYNAKVCPLSLLIRSGPPEGTVILWLNQTDNMHAVEDTIAHGSTQGCAGRI